MGRTRPGVVKELDAAKACPLAGTLVAVPDDLTNEQAEAYMTFRAQLEQEELEKKFGKKQPTDFTRYEHSDI